MRRIIASKPRKLTRFEVTVARVAQLIEAGKVLVASNVLAREETSVGPYREAVDRGIRFACIGDKGAGAGVLRVPSRGCGARLRDEGRYHAGERGCARGGQEARNTLAV